MYKGIYETIEQGLQAIEERLISSDRINTARFTYAVIKSNNCYRLAYAQIVFGYDQEQESLIYEYDRLILAKQWLSVENALIVISEILTKKWSINGINISEEYGSMQEYITLPVEKSVTGWREHVFSTSISGASSIDYKYYPLIAYDYPAFDTDLRAIAEWVFGDPGREQYIRNSEKFHVIIPDRKARIGRAHWAGNGIEVQIEGEFPPEKLLLKTIELNGARRIRKNKTVAPYKEGSVDLLLEYSMDRVSDYEIYLVDDSSDLLDYAKLKNSGRDYETPGGVQTLNDIVEGDLESGENEFIEFKPWISKTDPKENEILKTVVAFANTSGGRIYLGVKNDGTVQKSNQLTKAFNADETESLKRSKDRVTTLVRECLEPVPDVTIMDTQYGGEPIVIIEVAEGVDPPYATHSNDVYIRRGATNRKPAPSDELIQLLIKGNKVNVR